MARARNVMEVFKCLDKSNCRKCNEKTCMAFAAAVFKGEKPISDCPKLSEDVLKRFREAPDKEVGPDALADLVAQVRRAAVDSDLEDVAARAGGVYTAGKLSVRVLGKEVFLDREGALSSDIHLHGWVVGPLYHYLFQGAGLPPEGNWVPFRELSGGAARNSLFVQRCERPLQAVADRYTALFEDMMQLFGGRQVENRDASDIALVLHPFPKVPVLVCYWGPDEGMASSLTLFFDRSADQNIGTEALYTLAAGLVVMFEKLALRHGC